jgi:CheY-like chemotaxis protein
MNPVHILLAEDNNGDVFLIQQALQEHHIDHALHVVRDGGEALDFVLRMGTPDVPCPDLILLDLNLPKVEGTQVLGAIRKRPECSDTPVIVVTSSDAPMDKERVAKLGITSYFKKPFDLDEYMQLGATVSQALGARQHP